MVADQYSPRVPLQPRQGAARKRLWLAEVVAACVFAHSIIAQRVEDAVLGVKRATSANVAASGFNSSESRDTTMYYHLVSADFDAATKAQGAYMSPLTPTPRCDDIGPIVTAAVLGSLATGYLLSSVGAGKARDFVIPIVIITAVVVGVTAARCNR